MAFSQESEVAVQIPALSPGKRHLLGNLRLRHTAVPLTKGHPCILIQDLNNHSGEPKCHGVLPWQRLARRADLKSQESRRRLIHGILHAEKIHSQEELLKRLEKEGVDVTQATLSRDLKFLGVSRVPDGNGEYVYTVDPPKEPAQDPFIRDDLRREIVNIQFSGNLAVVKTKMGHAPGIAYGIDMLKIQDVIGTVGGDDTLLVVLREGADRTRFLRELTGEA
jgi:transcriptional regulator of arginine metabolism